MAKILPPSRPQQTVEVTRFILKTGGVDFKKYPVAILANRAYYKNTMGAPNKNDRGIYDDAIALVSPNVYATFNANTDPSIFRKHIASLLPGLWMYKIGVHGLSKPANRRYKALVQANEVTVSRDQENEDTGWFGINIHKGGYNTTSSEGCQTIYPDQWNAFIALIESELKRNSQKEVPYLLTENA